LFEHWSIGALCLFRISRFGFASKQVGQEQDRSQAAIRIPLECAHAESASWRGVPE